MFLENFWKLSGKFSDNCPKKFAEICGKFAEKYFLYISRKNHKNHHFFENLK